MSWGSLADETMAYGLVLRGIDFVPSQPISHAPDGALLAGEALSPYT